jgi:hypothetical protein
MADQLDRGNPAQGPTGDDLRGGAGCGVNPDQHHEEFASEWIPDVGSLTESNHPGVVAATVDRRLIRGPFIAGPDGIVATQYLLCWILRTG